MALYAQSLSLSGSFQAALPLELFDRLQRLRSRYAAALMAAAAGDYSRPRELRALSRYLGRLLAGEARKTPEQRGGLRMLDISLTVDRFFPELRGFTQHELQQRHRLRLLSQTQAS